MDVGINGDVMTGGLFRYIENTRCAADCSNHRSAYKFRQIASPALEFGLAILTRLALTLLVATMPLSG